MIKFKIFSIGKSKETWLKEAIDEYVGVRVPPERLRQFVEGVNTKDGGRKFPVPQSKSVEGIASCTNE